MPFVSKAATLTHLVEQALRANGISWVVVTGKVSPARRQQIVNEFSSNDVSVLLLSRVGAVGINLSSANILIVVVMTPHSAHLE
jgi:SNF2 family DNA or RNA helicase